MTRIRLNEVPSVAETNTLVFASSDTHILFAVVFKVLYTVVAELGNVEKTFNEKLTAQKREQEQEKAQQAESKPKLLYLDYLIKLFKGLLVIPLSS